MRPLRDAYVLRVEAEVPSVTTCCVVVVVQDVDPGVTVVRKRKPPHGANAPPRADAEA